MQKMLALVVMWGCAQWAGAQAPAKAEAASHGKKPAAKTAQHAKSKPAAASPASSAGANEHAAPLAPELMAIADQVHTGRLACEAGANVQLSEKPHAPGRFVLQLKQHRFEMLPVVSATGAIRLEDNQQGAVWIQLANKSMLMSNKLGQRLADECQSPAQATVAEARKLAPPINILEPHKDVARK